MTDVSLFNPPQVTDEDVTWVCDLLRLPQNAFSGAEGNDPRLEILKSNDTLDVEACPGSGKTTLLVAKLAILARKWTDLRRGLCVLSHTNVARREIEQHLGNTAVSKRLLSYPHFIGTIHGFVNEFLAIPWLRSKHFPIKMIDDEVCQTRRWSKLTIPTQSALEKNHYGQSLLKVTDVDFSVGDVRWGGSRTLLDHSTPTYQSIQGACKTTSEEGFFCYDEMFLWGNELLDTLPDIRTALRVRFPMLFIDEVQDNSEVQSALLFRLFTEGDRPVIRQRFGDANQAIYQHAGQTKGATTDQFPISSIRRDIPNSYRFGQEIGNLANPLALEPQTLMGCGPCRTSVSFNPTGKHTIFLFDDQTVRNVIGTYARYLMGLFSERELQVGTFTAIGGVHRYRKDDKLPRFVGHYWPSYDHELTTAEPKPKTIFQYLMAGRKLAHLSGESYHIVEQIAAGLLMLVRMSDPTANIGNRKRKHRYVLELLADNPEAIAVYLELVMSLVVGQGDPSIDDLAKKCSDSIIFLAKTIGGVQPNNEVTKAFLEGQLVNYPDLSGTLSHQRDNLFRYPSDNPKVQIRVGSIHSVKGETHTATLILETYYHGHHLSTLKPWLLAQKAGRGKEGVTNISRLKQHYVAMTRPSHLLCLAMREDTFTSEELNQLKSIPWRIARVTESEMIWL